MGVEGCDTNLKDHEIIALFFERSEQAVAELILKYETAIQRVASNILGDPQDIEECVNDAYLQIWNSIPPQRPQSLGAYACRVARNVSLNRYHANTAQKRNSYYDAALDELEGALPALSDVETELEVKELAAYISRFLRELPYDDRYLFLRRYWYAEPVSEIAKTLRLSPHAVSVRLFRIREKLQRYLKKEGMLA